MPHSLTALTPPPSNRDTRTDYLVTQRQEYDLHLIQGETGLLGRQVASTHWPLGTLWSLSLPQGCVGHWEGLRAVSLAWLPLLALPLVTTGSI